MILGSSKGTDWASDRRMWMEFFCRKRGERHGGLVARIIYEENIVSVIGRACLMEYGFKCRWWARCNYLCEKFGMRELVDLLWL